MTQETQHSQQEQQEAGSWAKTIFAITIFTEDLAATKHFYQQAFDLPVLFEDSNSVVFKFGETLINLLKTTEAPELIEPAKVASREAGARFVCTIQVEDVDAKCAELRAMGIELLNGPLDRPWGVRTASFMDPSGTIWEIAK